MSEAKISEHIDWLSITFPRNVPAGAVFPDGIQQDLVEQKFPVPVYVNGVVDKVTGIQYGYGREKRFGNHMIITGKPLRRMAELGIDLKQFWKQITAYSGKVTRIDLAVDVTEDGEFTPIAIQEMFLEGKCKTLLAAKTKKGKDNLHIGRDGKTETFYIGNPQSKAAHMRCYNKGIQSDIALQIWTRIEYEKRKNAQVWAKNYFEQGKSIRSLIKSAVDFPDWDLWQKIMGEEIAAISRSLPIDENEKSTEDWIVKSVIPAMAKWIIDDENLNPDELYKSKKLNMFLSILEERILQKIK